MATKHASLSQGGSKMKVRNGWKGMGLTLAAGAICLAFAVSMNAQVQTDTTTTKGEVSKTVQVERGEVVLVQGNDLVVKMEDGSIRHFPNVPDSARVTVDGKSLGIHDLKPGMKLQRTITTTSTPQTVKTVQTVTGKVWNVMPPRTVTLTLEDGTNQTFKTPEVVVSQQRQVTGTMPPPPPAPPADVPILVVVAAPAAAAPAAEAAPAAAAPAKLPKTGSSLPLAGLLGLLCLSASFALKLFRTKVG